MELFNKISTLVLRSAAVAGGDEQMKSPTAQMPNVVLKPVDPFMKEKKLIILSGAIPIIFISLIAFRQILEHNFRGSLKYKYIYSYGSTISLFIQLFLIIISFLLTIYVLLNRKCYNFWISVSSFILSSSVFLYVTIMLLIGFIKTNN